MFAGLLMLGSMFAGPATPAAPIRYKIDFKSDQVVDLTAVGQAAQQTIISFSGWVTVAMSDTTGGRIAHVVLDSVSSVNVPENYLPEVETAKGIVYHLYIVDGKAKSGLKPSKTNQFASWIQIGVDNLFPGAQAKRTVGEAWVDSVNTDNATPVGHQKASTVVSWKVSAKDGDAVSMDASAVGTIVGEAEQQGMKFQQTGKLTGTRAIKASLTGPALSGVIMSSQDVMVTAEALPEPIPIKAKNEIVISRLP